MGQRRPQRTPSKKGEEGGERERARERERERGGPPSMEETQSVKECEGWTERKGETGAGAGGVAVSGRDSSGGEGGERGEGGRGK